MNPESEQESLNREFEIERARSLWRLFMRWINVLHSVALNGHICDTSTR